MGSYSSIEFPSWARGLSLVVTGEQPGSTREGVLRSLADVVERVGGEVVESEVVLSGAVRRVKGGMRGRAGDAFVDRMGGLLGPGGLLADGSAYLGGAAGNLRAASTQVQYTKLMTLAGLLELWLELQMAALYSVFNPVGAAAWLAARVAAARVLLWLLRSRLGLVLNALLSGVLMEVASDFLVQAVQRNKGWRHGFDGSLLGSSAMAGVFGGAFGLVLGAGAGALAGVVRGSVGHVGAEVGSEVVGEVGVEVLTEGTVTAVETGQFDVTGFAATAGVAAAGASLLGGVIDSRVRSLLNRPDGAVEQDDKDDTVTVSTLDPDEARPTPVALPYPGITDPDVNSGSTDHTTSTTDTHPTTSHDTHNASDTAADNT
ncbi:hypothetical protein, partial [Micromonospora sp. NPDC093277]|uniref:hypothetical protein n=1 Tax=Micromonospora sp. NPDC093277 TaxID=3364291 RepID=UPI003807FF8F